MGAFHRSYVSPPEQITTATHAESCTLLRPDFAPDRIIDGIDAAKAASHIIAAAFPGRSERDVCIKASHALGASENTIRAILRCETKDASWRLISRAMVFLAAQGKDPLAVIGNDALTRIMSQAMGARQ